MNSEFAVIWSLVCKVAIANKQVIVLLWRAAAFLFVCVCMFKFWFLAPPTLAPPTLAPPTTEAPPTTPHPAVEAGSSGTITKSGRSKFYLQHYEGSDGFGTSACNVCVFYVCLWLF